MERPMSEPDTDADGDDTPSITRHAEELHVGAQAGVAGDRVREQHDTEAVRPVIERDAEGQAGVDRVAVAEADSGQIEQFEDGSLSIPVFEERLVVTKELVVRERVVVRKQTATVRQDVTTELRRERVVVEQDPEVEIVEAAGEGTSPRPA
jgi:stress response protein YsnF